MKTLVVNLCAGPGAGKSTMAAHVFALLKWNGVNCELATEYAKDKVWEESYGVFKTQPYVFGKQMHRLNRLVDKVDVIITDSPLILSTIYDNTNNTHFAPMVVEAFNSFNNLTYFVRRIKRYNPKGRMQTSDEAKELDAQITGVLHKNDIYHYVVDGSPDGVKEIVDKVMEMLNESR